MIWTNAANGEENDCVRYQLVQGCYSAARTAMLRMMIRTADDTRSHSVLMAIAASAVP
jgi:hypothetical protein